MLLSLRNSLYNSKYISKIIVAILVVLLVVPNLMGLLSSSSQLEQTQVASSAYASVDLKSLHETYPNEVNMIFRVAGQNPEYSRVILDKILKDLSLRDYVKQHNLLPSHEFIWNQLRSQIKNNLKDEDDSLTLEQIDQKVLSVLPTDLNQRSQALDNMRYQYAFAQLGRSLFDLGAPIPSTLNDHDYLYNSHYVNEYTVNINDFIQEADASDTQALVEYFESNTQKYIHDATYNIDYNKVNIDDQKLIEHFGHDKIVEQLALYDRTDVSDDDIADFAKVQFLSDLAQYLQQLNETSTQISADKANDIDFVKEHLLPLQQLDEFTKEQVIDYFGTGALTLFSESESSFSSEWKLVPHAQNYYIVKVNDYNPSSLMTYEQALSDVKQDFLFDNAQVRSKALIDLLVQSLKAGTEVDLTEEKWSGITMSQKSLSLKDKIMTSHSEPDKNTDSLLRTAQVFELTHPKVDLEDSVKVLHSAYDNNFKVLAYVPVIQEESNNSSKTPKKDDIDPVLQSWLEKNQAQSFVSLFMKLIDDEYKYVVNDKFLESVDSYTSEMS